MREAGLASPNSRCWLRAHRSRRRGRGLPERVEERRGHGVPGTRVGRTALVSRAGHSRVRAAEQHAEGAPARPAAPQRRSVSATTSHARDEKKVSIPPGPPATA